MMSALSPIQHVSRRTRQCKKEIKDIHVRKEEIKLSLICRQHDSLWEKYTGIYKNKVFRTNMRV